MKILEFTKEQCALMIKLHQKTVMTLRLTTYGNILLSLINGYFVYQNPSHVFTSICTGMLVSNALWSLCQLQLYKDDLRLEKLRMAGLKCMQDAEEYENELKLLKRMKKDYEDALTLLHASKSSPENKQPESMSLEVEK